MKNKTILINFIRLALCLIFLLFVVLTFRGSFSETVTSSGWGGAIASSFTKGNGTESNPYQIANGEEFAYFKQQLEQSYENYYNKSYVLVADINLGNLEWEPIGDETHPFSGTFDGKGHTIYNYHTTEPIIENQQEYYGLFSSLVDATIKNIQLSFQITPQNSENQVFVGGLSAKIKNSTVTNVAIIDSNIGLHSYIGTSLTAGLLIGKDDTGNTIKNLSITGSISDLVKDNLVGSVVGYLQTSHYENIITSVQMNPFSFSGNTIENPDIVSNYTYQVTNNAMTFASGTAEEVLSLLNHNIDKDYVWYVDENKFRIKSKVVPFLAKALSSSFVEHDSSISGSTVYVNDITADWNYYLGLNYTHSSNGTLPTGENQQLYGNDNLVKVQITYSSEMQRLNGTTLTSYISLSERQNKMVYYKVFPVNTNGTSSLQDDYIQIELIDNPFTDIPEGYAFNNWITNNSNVELSYDNTYYTRYAKIPVTYTNGIPNDLTLDLSMGYTEATVGRMSQSGNWAGVSNNFLPAGMTKVENVKVTLEPYDMTGYYFQKVASFGSRYSGYNANGNYISNQTCWSWGGGCTYYEKINGEYYSEGNVYYELRNGRMSIVDNNSLPIVEHEEENKIFDGMNMAGFYRKVVINRNQSLVGYYDYNGNKGEGVCTSSSGCTYYQLITAGEWFHKDSEYYYMVTRDTNIAVIDRSITDGWDSNLTEPFLVTSTYGGVDYRNSAMIDIASSDIICYANTRIENVKIYTSTYRANTDPAYQNSGWWSSSKSSFFGNFKNVKIGRGIVQEGVFVNFQSIIGGGNAANNGTGNSSNPTKYRMIIESGHVNTIAFVNATSGPTVYTEMKSILGSDYDRVAKNNSNLDVYYCASGSWGGNLYASKSTAVAIDLTVKSGTFGSGKYDYTTGIYVGGRSGGTHYAIRQITYEGGNTYNLIGGPLSASNRTNLNDIIMYIKGGTIDMITGGAGRTATYGHRIIQLTGGTINYSVFGGSNGYEGSSSDGTVNGSGYIYAGGNTIIGSSTLVGNRSTLFGSEAGSIFGIGNGRNGYTQIGSSDNSYVIVDQSAHILGNVYGGGNYGATGISSAKSQTETKITVLNGQIDGSIYGGGNRNGAGSSKLSSTIQIAMHGGTVKGNIYGGSNEEGVIYGDIYIDMYGGKVNQNIYGGGKGGTTSSPIDGTFVTGNVTVTVGSEKVSYTPTILGSVYGGSAYGTVGGSSSEDIASSMVTTNVTVNQGVIQDAVYGGGKGDATYTPHSLGDVFVNINGGNIGKVFGGNDAAGEPSGQIYVFLNGGTIGSAFGGGNNANVKETNIMLLGATVDYLFGGSNMSGVVDTSYVTINSGKVNYVYGGNNIGGTFGTSHVEVKGGHILKEIYGGGNEIGAATSNLNLSISDNRIPYAYGGGKAADVTNSNIQLQGASVENLFGGSNTAGTVTTSMVLIKSGEVTNVYGGNNAGGTTINASITVSGSKVGSTVYGGGRNAKTETSVVVLNALTNQIPYVYGGGHAASVNTTTITVTGAPIGELYGGSNNSGVVTTSNIEVQSGAIGSIYGGGNKAAVQTPSILVKGGTIETIFGGGNEAEITTSSHVTIQGGTIHKNIYGGGNFGEILQNTYVHVANATVLGSIYGGGNGTTAIVYGNTTLNIEGATTVGETTSIAPQSGSVFGGGNAAATGLETDKNSTATVNIVGATIYGNVYGGANTSVVYGTTRTNIGKNTVSNTTMTASDIYIKGTVFGGGEANASGDENYDFSFISVTNGILVQIDGKGHARFQIDGSIFGSGNASSTSGTSAIHISNYGTKEDCRKNISIQRTGILTIINSHFELSGAKDRTNEYSDVLFTISRVDEVKLANNSSLYLKTGANLLKKLTSLKIENNTEELSVVTINEENKTVTKNVDNRLYLLEGKNINIATNESATSYGEVRGMTFLGMYRLDRDQKPITGLYDASYQYGDVVPSNDLYLFTKGSYVLGLHKSNHNITVDGFYSNFNENETAKVRYIDPTPKDSTFYMWVIGEKVTEYNVNLIASKYSTLGAVELPLLEFSSGNTSFSVLDFNYNNLEAGVTLIEAKDIPRVASNSNDADNIMGLAMKNSNTGWMTSGKTEFLTNELASIVGTNTYKSENSTVVPSLLFYLYHSKNLATSGNMGSVTISLMAVTRIDDLTNETKRIVINVDLSRALYTTNDYEGAITAGRAYELFTSTVTNITSNSSFSTYFSLYAESETSLYKKGYHRALVSSYILPVNTEITLIDLSNNEVNYYYHVITEEDVTKATAEHNLYGEASYKFSIFMKMGSTSPSNRYQDEEKNQLYYNETTNINNEEFIIIVDFKSTNITADSLNNSMLMELRDGEEQTIINVLGIQQQQMTYHLYTEKDAVIELSGSLNKDSIYKGEIANLVVHTNYLESSTPSNNAIYDTNFFDQKLGLKISILDETGKLLSGTTVFGLYFELDGQKYYPNMDGTTRINIASKVANVESRIKINTEKLNITSGNYIIKIESFASADGIYYGLSSSYTIQLPFQFINKVYGLQVTTEEKAGLIDHETGYTQNLNNSLIFFIQYHSALAKPNIRVKMYRRRYDDVYTTNYDLVDLQDYVKETLITTSNDKEYRIINNPVSNNTQFFYMKENIMTGTYRLVFSLYDDNTLIGDVEKYIIIE